MKVYVLTGKRGGYEAMRPMLRQMQKMPEFDLRVLACDMHVNRDFGETIYLLKEDGFEVYPAGLNPENRIDSLRQAFHYFSELLRTHPPDLVVLFGDRAELLTVATPAVTLGIPIVHIQGGDQTGTSDDIIRGMVSKAANMHFVSNDRAAMRLTDIGEKSERIFVVGDPHLDEIISGDIATPEEVRKMMGIDPGVGPLILLLHPDPIEQKLSPTAQAREVVEALRDEPCIVVIFPCSDPGYEEIIKEIKGLQGIIWGNVERRFFLGLMAIARAMVGNSSAGIIEAPYLGLPVVNIGNRQHGRVQTANVINTGYDRKAIRYSLERLPKPEKRYPKLYGHGSSGRLIIEKILDNQHLLKTKVQGYE